MLLVRELASYAQHGGLTLADVFTERCEEGGLQLGRAPSTPAVDLAAETGMTLVGFPRGKTMNVYAGPERIR